MDARSLWFLTSGLLVLLVSHCVRVVRQRLALRRAFATAGSAAALPAPIAVRGAA